MLVSTDTLNQIYIQLWSKNEQWIRKVSFLNKNYLSQTFYDAKCVLTFFTKTVWISNISWKTDTDSSMVFGSTFSVSTTWVGVTWVLAFLLYTCKVIGTLWVNCTFWSWSWKKSCSFIVMPLDRIYLSYIKS